LLLDKSPKKGYALVGIKVPTRKEPMNVVNISSNIMKAEHFGIKDLRSNASSKIFEKIFVVTTKGKPVSVNLPYSDILNLIDMIDEISDPETLRLVKEHRDALKGSKKCIPAINLFQKIRKNRS